MVSILKYQNPTASSEWGQWDFIARQLDELVGKGFQGFTQVTANSLIHR